MTPPNSATSTKPGPQPPQAVPLLDLTQHHAALLGEMTAALERVCRSGAFVLGPEVTELEKRIADYCQAKHAIGCASGSDALLLALMALDIGPGDEVIVPSFTFFATASAVARLGATPVFADIEPEAFNLDPEAVRAEITPVTKAILPVHLFGQCADMDALGRIAAEAELPLIEDAAQAIGAEHGGRHAGSIGRVGCLSFYPTKNLGGAGDGGMLTTNDDALAERLRLIRVHGMQPRYYHHVIGINSRLDSFQAAVLNVKMPHLEHYTRQRRANAERYGELFAAAGLDRSLGLPRELDGRRHVWNQYVVRVPGGRRDALRQHLAEVKIGSEVYYPLGLHEQTCFAYLGYKRGDLPETDRAAAEVLALPIFPELTAEQQQVVVDRIGEFFKPVGGHALAGPKYLKHATTHAGRQRKE
jgi:dTDP-4-amino-4,6-dideoxygalactose transaminase